jgi:hypothetical protein
MSEALNEMASAHSQPTACRGNRQNGMLPPLSFNGVVVKKTLS